MPRVVVVVVLSGSYSGVISLSLHCSAIEYALAHCEDIGATDGRSIAHCPRRVS